MKTKFDQLLKNGDFAPIGSPQYDEKGHLIRLNYHPIDQRRAVEPRSPKEPLVIGTKRKQ